MVRWVAVLLLCACTGARESARPREDSEGIGPRVGLDLSYRNLVGRRFEGQELYRIRLVQSDVSGSSFAMSFLASADLRGAVAVDTSFRQADLSRADFASARLRGADLRQATLFEANLFDADLRGASLAGANVRNARFARAHLSGTVLEPLEGWSPEAFADVACWDERTRWPEGFAPVAEVQACHLHRD